MRLRISYVLLLASSTAFTTPAFAKSHRGRRPAQSAGVSKNDIEAKALVRKQAPFVVEESTRGDEVRVNKDGSFAMEGQTGSFNSQGRWKVKDGKLMLKWNSGEEYGYSLTFKGKTPLLEKQAPSKEGRYRVTLNRAAE